MDTSTTPPPIVILGPTAGGKSDLAVALAERLKKTNSDVSQPVGGEIISADSMQVYRGLDVGTAKPPVDLRQRIAHHLIDVVEPTQRFTVADWLDQTRRAIAQIHDRGQQPIVVGGTNLYLKALIQGMISGPQPDPAFRQSLNQWSNEQLHRRLTVVDHESAQRISVNDRKRMVRALEVQRNTGKPISQLQGQWDQEPTSEAGDDKQRLTLIGLRWDKAALNPRINARVKRMFFPQAWGLECESLAEETRRLVDEGRLGTPDSRQANEAIGYKQCLAAMRGEMTWDDALEKTKIATRRLAKHQRTWLKRFQGVHWLEAIDASLEELVEQALNQIHVP